MSDVTPIALDLDLGELEAEDENEDAAPKGKGLGLIPLVAAGVVAAGVAGGAAFVLTPAPKTINPACLDDAAGKHGEDGAHSDKDDHGAAKDSHGGDHNDGHDDGHGEKADKHGEDGEHEAIIEECPTEDEEHGEDDKKDKKKKKKADKGHGGKDGGESKIKPLGEVTHAEHATFLVVEPMVISIQPIGRSKHLRVSLVFETDDAGAEILLDNGFYVQDVLNTYLRSVDHTVLEDPSSMSRLRAQILRRIRVVVPDASVTNVLITEFILT